MTFLEIRETPNPNAKLLIFLNPKVIAKNAKFGSMYFTKDKFVIPSFLAKKTLDRR